MSDGAAARPPALALLDCTSFKLLARNLQQKDESGDSRFGIGLDWDYGFEHSWEEIAFAPTVSLSGQGRVSLGDPNGSRADANRTASGNSILNQLRITAKGIHGPSEPRLARGPFPVTGTEEQREAWKQAASEHVKKVAYIQATGYTALDFGLQVRSESSQDLADTQVAVGVGATAASGWLSQKLLWPLRYFVPDAESYGDVVQSPILFVAFDGVFAADYRTKIDGASDDRFERFRLELGWTTELVTRGLYPFVHFNFHQELRPESAIKAADKDSTTFVEVGADYYVGQNLEGVRRFFGGGKPFVTLKYATGRLPPYLESDSQVSVGLGLTF